MSIIAEYIASHSRLYLNQLFGYLLAFHVKPSIGIRPPSNHVLPQELVDLIVDEVALTNDRNSLLACSLVSRAFHYAAYNYLFTTIELLVDSAVDKRAARLRDIIHSDPHLIPNLRQLTLVIGDWPERAPPTPSRHIQIDILPSFSSIMKNFRRRLAANMRSFLQPHFLKLLEDLSHAPLKKLTIDSLKPTSWEVFNKDEESRLLAISSSPSLEVLELANVKRIPGYMVVGALEHQQHPKLRHLILRNCRIDHPLLSQQPIRLKLFPPYSNITSLEVIGDALWNFSVQPNAVGIFSILRVPLFRFPALQNLIVNLGDGTAKVECAWRIMAGAAGTLSSLEILDMGLSDSNFGNLGVICLSSLVALRHLTFSYPSARKNYFSPDTTEDCLTLINNFLRSATGPANVEVVTIDFGLRYTNPTKARAWAALDQTLSGAKFPNLKQVVVKATFTVIDDDWDVGGRAFEDGHFLPRLAAWTQVKIDVQVFPSTRVVVELT